MSYFLVPLPAFLLWAHAQASLYPFCSENVGILLVVKCSHFSLQSHFRTIHQNVLDTSFFILIQAIKNIQISLQKSVTKYLILNSTLLLSFLTSCDKTTQNVHSFQPFVLWKNVVQMTMVSNPEQCLQKSAWVYCNFSYSAKGYSFNNKMCVIHVIFS